MVAVARELGPSEFAGALGELGGSAAQIDFGRSLRACSVYLAAQAKRCFDEARSPDGTAWPPLKRPRSGRRHRKAKAHRPLRDTGILMASVTATAGARGSVKSIAGLSLEQGTVIDYAGYHQYGTRTIPKRPFLGITDAMADRMTQLVALDVEKQIVSRGLKKI